MNAFERRHHERNLELAASAIDFELTSAETSELEAHLAVCSRCSRDAAALRADATAIRVPLGLLPSRRVDEAVYREIARGEARPQGFLLLVAAALLLLGLLAAVAVGAALLLDRDPLPITLVPLPSAVVDNQAPNASPAAQAPPGEDWEALDVQAGASGGLIEAAALAGRDLVGVGRVGCAGDPVDDPTGCYGAAWTAGPGESLTRVPDQDGLRVGISVPTSGPEKGIFDVAAGPSGIVAIGFDYDPSTPGLWRSTDGRTWERVDVAFGSTPSEAYYIRVAAVAASQQGYVIVGHVIEFGGPEPVALARAAAWFSPDGLTWTRAGDTADMDVGPCFDTGEDPSCGGMLGVTPTDSGFVAVGQARSDAGSRTQPAAWTSKDGLTWARSDTGLEFDGHLSSVTVAASGIVAVGRICQPSCADLAGVGGVAAASRDGSTWSFTPVAGATALTDVAFTGGQAFALGASVVLEPPADLELWRSDDGIVWQRVPGLPSIPGVVSTYRAADIAAAPDRLIVVGWAEVTGAGAFRNFAYVSPPSGSSAPATAVPSG